MASTNDSKDVAAGYAALAICESLLLALTELKVFDGSDARGILEDAAATHRGAEDTESNATLHDEAAHMIEHIISVRYTLSGR